MSESESESSPTLSALKDELRAAGYVQKLSESLSTDRFTWVFVNNDTPNMAVGQESAIILTGPELRAAFLAVIRVEREVSNGTIAER